MTDGKWFEPYPILRRRKGSKQEPLWSIQHPGPGPRFAKKQLATKLRGKEFKPQALELARKLGAKLKQKQLVERGDGEGPWTVRRWAKEWLRTRSVKGIETVEDYASWLNNNVLPYIGDKLLTGVTPEDIVDVMERAAKRVEPRPLAPRSQRHIYFTMRTLFNKAIRRKLLDDNPCQIDPEDLPAKIDADPEWRSQATFSRDEVRLILTDPRIPIDRRVYYAVMFLAGMRFGEVSALHVNHYRTDLKPLGRLTVARSYNTKKKRLKGTKTNKTRLVPVHPWLEQILGWWLAVGFEELTGRPPTQDDVLIPNRRGKHRSSDTMWKQCNGEKPSETNRKVVGDLERIGLRNRRLHDTRHAFITLLRDDGAADHLIKLMSHGFEGDILDTYTAEAPWRALCTEMLKLQIGSPAPEPLTFTPNPSGYTSISSEISHNPGLPWGCHSPKLEANREVTMRPQRDSNPEQYQGLTPPSNASDRKSAAVLAFEPPRPRTTDASARPGPTVATLATLAMRRALAALERGRVDEAMAILRGAVAEEATEPERERGGGGRRVS